MCFDPSSSSHHHMFIHINSYEPIYHVPSAFHILILPKFPHGSYYYSHGVDRYVCYVTDKGVTNVILFSLTYINLNLCTSISTCHCWDYFTIPSVRTTQRSEGCGLKQKLCRKRFGFLAMLIPTRLLIAQTHRGF